MIKRNPIIFLIIFSVVFSLTLFSDDAYALECDPSAPTFTVVKNGDWDDPATWDKGVVPSINAIKKIPHGYYVVISSTVENYCIIENTGTLTNSGDLLNYSPGIFNNRATLTNSHTLSNSGTFTNSGTLTNFDFLRNKSPGTTTNSGTINNCGGTIQGTISGNVVTNICP